MTSRSKCTLKLSNNMEFVGQLIGSPVNSSGELVFTTGMVGYSEALTDPSYFGQILIFTYPLIGNYGIPKLPEKLTIETSRGFESGRVHVSAVILAVESSDAFHWSSRQTLHEWLLAQNVPGIIGLDTRELVHIIRSERKIFGSVFAEDSKGHRSNIFNTPPQIPAVFFDPSEHEVVRAVSCQERYIIGRGSKRVTVIDTGVKWNILRQLVGLGVEVEVLPWDYDFSRVDTSGWLLSNGPGDPAKTGDLKQRISQLLSGSKPILGICLGHQLLALAAGGTTSRMAYGHRSHNQPVQLVGTRKGFITSQNHGFMVDENSLMADWEPWFVNANDQTIEGIRHKSKPFRSVQFHPEAAGGPRDTGWIIEQFVKEL